MSEVCQNGCSAGACVGSRQSVSDLIADALARATSTKATSTPGAGKSGQKSTSSLSAFDRILLLTEPAPVGSAETDPFVLTIDGDDTVSLEGNPAPPEALAPPGDAYGGVPSGAQQTFISGDLRESAGQSAYPSQQISGLRKTLETMKATLLRVLAYLRPFGRPQSEAFDEWAE